MQTADFYAIMRNMETQETNAMQTTWRKTYEAFKTPHSSQYPAGEIIQAPPVCFFPILRENVKLHKYPRSNAVRLSIANSVDREEFVRSDPIIRYYRCPLATRITVQITNNHRRPFVIYK